MPAVSSTSTAKSRPARTDRSEVMGGGSAPTPRKKAPATRSAGPAEPVEAADGGTKQRAARARKGVAKTGADAPAPVEKVEKAPRPAPRTAKAAPARASAATQQEDAQPEATRPAAKSSAAPKTMTATAEVTAEASRPEPQALAARPQETAAAETTAAEVKAAETTAREAAARQTAAPEAATRETTAPETAAHATAAPETTRTDERPAAEAAVENMPGAMAVEMPKDTAKDPKPARRSRRGRTTGPSIPLGSLTQLEHRAVIHCHACGSTRVTRLSMNLTDGTPVEFTSCHRCEHRTWEHAGDTLDVGSVLDRTRRE